MSNQIKDYCFGCGDPIFVGDKYEWVAPRKGEYDEIYHEDCASHADYWSDEEYE